MGFGKYQPLVNLSPEIKKAISNLENTSTDQMSYLRAVYSFVLEKNSNQWGHTRFKAGTHLHRLFVKDINEIWNTKKFVYCTAINFLVFALLVGSKFFKKEGIRTRYVFVNFVVHQYLQVKAGENWTDVDPAGSGIRGKPLGTHLSWFG